ncbi:9004_t:CDS:2, partial [Dentiscutata erythropus]
MNKRTQSALTLNKKTMVVSVYNYFNKNNQIISNNIKNFKIHNEVAIATGVGTATVARIITEYKKTKTITASKQGKRPLKKIDSIEIAKKYNHQGIVKNNIVYEKSSLNTLQLRNRLLELFSLEINSDNIVK